MGYPKNSHAADLCQFCGNQRGYGDHEKYCKRNPENLARKCEHDGCDRPGNCVTDHGFYWQCEQHQELSNAKSFFRSRKNSVEWTKRNIEYMKGKLAEEETKLVQAEEKLVEARKRYKKVKFKSGFVGIE